MSATAPTGEAEDSVARLAMSYDELHYPSSPIHHSQPAFLSGIARLFGLDSAPLASARVLELGCASGGNMIPHAMRYPDARFVGVDIGRGQVEAGKARIEALGLSNIELFCESITEVDGGFGSFDYIICHGVYSWVPSFVQDAIFRVIRERLSPVGVACVSYNVLPGWRGMQIFRDALLLKIPQEGGPVARVAAARELLGFMRDSTVDNGPYGDLLRQWGDKLAGQPDYYLAHEYLEHENHPTTVQDFADRAAGHRLAYLAEVGVAGMNPDNYGEQAAHYVRTKAQGDVVAQEQYLDLLSGRTFRQSLLVSDERQAMIERDIRPERFAALHYVPQPGIEISQEPDRLVVKDAAGHWIVIDSLMAADAIRRFGAGFPSSSTFEECVAGIAITDADRGKVLETLYRMLNIEMIAISAEPMRSGRDEPKPRAIALARADAAAESSTTASIRHERIDLDAVMRALLLAMDGTLDHPALASRLVAEALAGRLGFAQNDTPVTDAVGLRVAVDQQLPVLLKRLADAGLIEAGA